MITKSLTVNPLSRLVSPFISQTVTGKVNNNNVQAKFEDHQLLQMLSQQKRINHLTYVWTSDEDGKVHGSWVKSSS